jgi:hypothetical protein
MDHSGCGAFCVLFCLLGCEPARKKTQRPPRENREKPDEPEQLKYSVFAQVTEISLLCSLTKKM